MKLIIFSIYNRLPAIRKIIRIFAKTTIITSNER